MNILYFINFNVVNNYKNTNNDFKLVIYKISSGNSSLWVQLLLNILLSYIIKKFLLIS